MHPKHENKRAGVVYIVSNWGKNSCAEVDLLCNQQFLDEEKDWIEIHI